MIIELFLITTLVQDPPNATIGQNVVWDHDGLNTDHYEVNFDMTTWTSSDMNKTFPIPTLPPGQHTVYIRACGVSMFCSDPLSLLFNLIAAPHQVANISIAPITPLTTPTPRSARPVKPGVKK